MNTPAQKLKWDDLDPVDTQAAEANAAAARSRVQSAIKEDKAATRAGTQAGIGYKLSWDDLTPVEGARQPSRVTSSGWQPSTWGQGDTSPINRAPRSAVNPAATATGDEGLAQPGATFAHKPTDILTYEPKAADILLGQRGPAYPEREVPWRQPLRRAPRAAPSFADDVSRRSGRQARVLQQGGEAREAQAQADRRRQAARGMVRSVISAAAGVPASVIPDVVTETAADIGGGLTSVAGPIVIGESKPSIFNPIKSAVLQIPGVQRAVDNTVGRVGHVLQESGSDISEQAGAPDGVRRDIGRAVGGLIPMLAARAPFAIAAVAYDEAKGQGADEQTAIEHGLTSAATVGVMGGAAKAISRAVPEAGAAAGLTRFGMRAAANAAAVPLIGAPGKVLHGENAIPTDREKVNAAVMGTGFAALPHPVEPSAVRRSRARAQYEAQRTAEESAPLYPRVNIAPTEKGVESAISTQLGTRQPLSSPRVVKRAIAQPQAESPVRPAPASPAPTQTAQRGDFETGLEGMTAQTAPRVTPSEPSLTPAPTTKSATSPAVENQSNESTRADVAAPNYAVGDHIISPTGKTFRVEAVSGDQTHVRAINRNGKPTGRTIPLRLDDIAQFERAQAKPITVRAVSGPRTVNPETHSLTDAISILGFDGTTQEGKDLAAYVQKRPGTINNTRLSNGEKRGIDNYLIPALRDLDYDVTDTNDLLDKVRSQKPVYSQHYYEAQAERDIQDHLTAEHQAWLEDKPDSQGQSESDILFRAGKSPEFVGLLNRLHDPDATAEDEARFYEEATHRQKLPDDLATQLIETATARRNEQRINQHGVRDVAQSATQPRQSGQRPQERGTELRPAEGEGDVNDAGRIRSTGDRDASNSRQESLVAGTDGTTKPAAISTDDLSHVKRIFEHLKAKSTETGQSLTTLVNDWLRQGALPAMEDVALSPKEAEQLRGLVAGHTRRAPVAETQAPLLDTAPTVESRQAQTQAAETRQAEGAKNAPLFEGVKAPSIYKSAQDVTRALYRDEEIPADVLAQYPYLKRASEVMPGVSPEVNEQKGQIVTLANLMHGREAQIERAQERLKSVEPPTNALDVLSAKDAHKDIEKAQKQLRQYSSSFEVVIRAAQDQPHHSHLQPRTDAGTFTVDKPKVAAFHRQLLESGKSVDQYLSQPELFGDELTEGEREHLRELGEPARQAVAEHGQFARFLFHASERGKGDAFLNDSAVKKALALPDSASLTTVHNKLRADLGMETNKKVSPESLYGWAADKNLPHGAVEKIKRAEDSAVQRIRDLDAQRKREGGFLLIPNKQQIADIKNKVQDKLSSLYVEGFLRPSGAARVGTGLALKQGMDWTGDLIGSTIDLITSRSSGKVRAYEITPADIFNAAVKGLPQGVRSAGKTLMGKPSEMLPHYKETDWGNAIANAGLQPMRRLFAAKEATAKGPGYQTAVREMARTLQNLPTQARQTAIGQFADGLVDYKNEQHQMSVLESMRYRQQLTDDPQFLTSEYAAMEAEKQVGAQPNRLSTAIRSIGKEGISVGNIQILKPEGITAKAVQTALNIEVPFFKRPANAIKTVIGDYLGINAIHSLPKAADYYYGRMPIPEQQAFVKAIGKGMVGHAIFFMGLGLQRAGLATGVLDDDKERLGASLKVGNTYYQIGHIPFFGTLFTLGATVGEMFDGHGIGELPKGIAKVLTEHPLLRAGETLLGTANELYQGKSSVGSALKEHAANITSRFVPSTVSSVAQAIDRNENGVIQRRTKDEGFLAPTAARVPGLRSTLPAVVNPQTKEARTQPFFSPIATRQAASAQEADASAIHSAYRAANPLPPMTPLQKTKFDAKKEIESAIQRGDANTSDIIKRNVDAGLVSDDEVFDLAAAAHKSGEEKMVEEFKKTPSVERKLDVFMKLSKATRDKLREELEDSWADSAMKLTPHERAVLGPRVGQALGIQ